MNGKLILGMPELIAKSESMARWQVKIELLHEVHSTDGNSKSYDNEDVNHIKVDLVNHITNYL